MDAIGHECEEPVRHCGRKNLSLCDGGRDLGAEGDVEITKHKTIVNDGDSGILGVFECDGLAYEEESRGHGERFHDQLRLNQEHGRRAGEPLPNFRGENCRA